MAGHATTVARPYAEAVFERARETGRLGEWAETLQFLADAMREPELVAFVTDPKLTPAQRTEVMLDLGRARLDAEAQNLVRALVENDRLVVLPEIAALYETRKREAAGQTKVVVSSALPLDAAVLEQLAGALKAKLGQQVEITTEEDPSLIGGVRIRAGDTVIDGSVRGRLHQLANELGI
jgi:F-type H+-transporting ATPase subunit delta